MLPQRENLDNTDSSGEKSRVRQDAAGVRSPESAYTHIPNAHAAGVGAMGRNDEKLPSSDDVDDEADIEQDSPVY